MLDYLKSSLEEVFLCWTYVYEFFLQNKNNHMVQILNNLKIQIENKPVLFKHYFNAGIFLFCDLFDLDGNF